MCGVQRVAGSAWAGVSGWWQMRLCMLPGVPGVEASAVCVPGACAGAQAMVTIGGGHRSSAPASA